MMHDLPPGWARTTLEKIASWGSGGTPKRSEQRYYGGGIPWAVIGDLNDGKVMTCSNSITQKGLDNSSCKVIEPGTVLIAMYGSIGKLGIAGMQMATNQAIAFAGPHIDHNYLFYYLQSQRNALSVAGKGATQRNISQTVLKAWPIPVAPPAEQERIVAAIEEHFSRIDAVETSLTAAEMRCQALTRSIIVRSIPNKLPEDWRLKTVAEAGETGLGRQRSPKYHSGPNMKPYLRVANVFEDRVDTSSIMKMHFEGAEFNKYRLRYGDVLLNEGQSPELLGRPAIYRGEPPDVAFTNSLIRFVPGPGVMSEWALLVFRRHMHARRFMRESRITTNIAHLALGRFRTVEFPIPPLDTQHEVVASTRAALSSIDQTIVQIKSARAKANGIRRAVLAAAFSGQLVPQDPSDEHASLLLERIAASRSTKPNRRASARQVS